VFRPRFRTTRRTAKSLAENEWVRSHCRALTLPQRPSRVAFAIRLCSRRTCSSMGRQSMASQLGAVEDAPSDSTAALVICLSSFKRFSRLSRDERPVGRRPTCVSGNVQTRIRPVTGRPSLLPTSQTRSAMGAPHGALSRPEGRTRYGVSTFRYEKYAGLGVCYRPGSRGPRQRGNKTLLPPPIPFGSSASTTSACSQLRSLTQIQMPSPYRLSSTHPVVVTRRVRLSRFEPRTRGASFHCQGSS
jgi:hypothetical protein